MEKVTLLLTVVLIIGYTGVSQVQCLNCEQLKKGNGKDWLIASCLNATVLDSIKTSLDTCPNVADKDFFQSVIQTCGNQTVSTCCKDFIKCYSDAIGMLSIDLRQYVLQQNVINVRLQFKTSDQFRDVCKSGFYKKAFECFSATAGKCGTVMSQVYYSRHFKIEHAVKGNERLTNHLCENDAALPCLTNNADKLTECTRKISLNDGTNYCYFSNHLSRCYEETLTVGCADKDREAMVKVMKGHTFCGSATIAINVGLLMLAAFIAATQHS